MVNTVRRYINGHYFNYFLQTFSCLPVYFVLLRNNDLNQQHSETSSQVLCKT